MSARLHGKLPAHGDFVTRGFTREVAEQHDTWLSASLAEARAVHGAVFDERYGCAPTWRFVRGGTAGALALSQDAVGRQFPVLIFLDTAAVFTASAALDELLYRAVAEQWTADELVAAAVSLDLPSTPEPVPGSGCWFSEGRQEVLTGTRPPDLLTRMLSVEVDA